MQVIIINDCRDENVEARQRIRASHLFMAPTRFIGVTHELQASGNIIDALDALDNTPGVILVNVAPRHGKARKWPNGTPFGYLWYRNTLIASTVDGLTLSMIKKMNLAHHIRVLDTQKATEMMAQDNFIPPTIVHSIVKSQFRSFDFLPRIAAYILKTKKVLGEELSLATLDEAPRAVWHIDNFGNAKTTLFPYEINFTPKKKIKTAVGEIMCYAQLRDVPDHELGIVVGSSGLGDKRFIEIVLQGGNAAEQLQLSIGSRII